MNSLQAITNKIIAFYTAHKQVFKVGTDFKEQLYNFATQNEKYPLVYIVPSGVIPTENTTEFTFDIYCYDIIQKDRANIITILSDTQQILSDLNVYFNDSTDYDFDVVGLPTFTPLNNDLLDYAAGYQMTITLTVNDWTDCAVPLNTNEATISVYSQVIDFMAHPVYNSIQYMCDAVMVEACYDTGGFDNIPALVNLFNTPQPNPLPVYCNDPSLCLCWSTYGTYYDNGDGTIRLEMPVSIYNSLCPGGTLTLNVIQD